MSLMKVKNLLWKTLKLESHKAQLLGLIFFLLYVNDIVENVKCNIRLFADDTSLFTVIENADSTHRGPTGVFLLLRS